MAKKENKPGIRMGRRRAGMRIAKIVGAGIAGLGYYEWESLKHMAAEPGAHYNRGILDLA